MMAMIKANSYGTGSFEIAQTLEHHKIDYLGQLMPTKELNSERLESIYLFW